MERAVEHENREQSKGREKDPNVFLERSFPRVILHDADTLRK